MDILKERYKLSMERIREIREECDGQNPPCGEQAAGYFKEQAELLLYLDEVRGALLQEAQSGLPSLEILQERNRRLYAGISGKAYETSGANPAVTASLFGPEAGRKMAFLAAELRGGIAYVYEDRMEEWVPCLEIFIEVYNIFESKEINEFTNETFLQELQEALYYYISDYCDVTVARRIREQLDPSLDFAVRIIMESNLSDLRYLHRTGKDNEDQKDCSP